MSRENVELIRGIYDAVARRDDVTPFEVYARDIVWDVTNQRLAGLLSKPLYNGHDGVRQFWGEGVSLFSEIDFEVEELIDADDQVLAVVRARWVGRASGAAVTGTHVAVWTIAGDEVIQLQTFDDRAQAFDAAGLMT